MTTNLLNIKLNTPKGSIVKVYINPTGEDYYEMHGRFTSQYPAANVKRLKTRVTRDKHGNEYRWMCGDATHEMIESQLKDLFGITANQNARMA
jgi:hypothetical protein